MNEHTESEFNKLRMLNDKYDITYNHNKDNSNKMFLINLIENCYLFSGKTTEQLEKILNMLEEVYGGKNMLNEVHYWQFK